jgi:hypothetical protein
MDTAIIIEEDIPVTHHKYRIYFDWECTVYRYCDNNEIIDELFFWDILSGSYFDYWGHEYILVEQ